MREARPIWVARLIAPPFDEKTGRHGGQIACRASKLVKLVEDGVETEVLFGLYTEEEAVSAANELIREHPVEWNRGARAVVEPGFWSRGVLGNHRRVWGRL